MAARNHQTEKSIARIKTGILPTDRVRPDLTEQAAHRMVHVYRRTKGRLERLADAQCRTSFAQV